MTTEAGQTKKGWIATALTMGLVITVVLVGTMVVVGPQPILEPPTAKWVEIAATLHIPPPILRPPPPPPPPPPPRRTPSAPPPKIVDVDATPPMRPSPDIEIIEPEVPTVAEDYGGEITVKGDVTTIWLVSPSGRFKPNNVPPGAYDIEASFDEKPISKVGNVTVETDRIVNVRCFGITKTCSVGP